MTHKLTNAEATDDLSTAYGAVTGELLAAAVAANEDVANSAALVYTQNTRNLALTVGRTIGADLSTQVVLPALTQTQAEDETSTVPGLVTGELLSQAVAVGGGGGGGGSPDRIVLASSVGVSNTTGPHEIALTEAMVARQLLSFFVFSSATASPDGIGYLLSDDILALTAEATAPTDAENALPVVTASYSASNFSQQSGNYFVYRKDDSTLWVRPTRLAAHTLTITATPLGGGGDTSQQQATSGLTRTAIVTPPSAPLPLTTTPTSSAITVGTPSQIGFVQVHKDSFHSLELQISVGGVYQHNISITKEMLDNVGASAGRPDAIPDYTVPSRCFYTSGRPRIDADSQGADASEPDLLLH